MKNRFEQVSGDESGFTTAELLGNAALGVAALVVVWAALGGVADGIIDKMKTQLGISG